MSTSTIYVKSISAFDASKSYVVTFGYSGVQCIKNRIIVYDNSTNAVVYDDTITTFTLSHTIPANTLTNGNSYYCTITAYYTVNNVEQSITSSASSLFKCLTTPVWAINGLSEGSVIGNSYYTFTINYSQAQGELVNEYYIILYNASGSVYWTSNTLHDISASTTVTGLPNDAVLYARAYGTTVNGLSLDTGKISVSVDYIAPTLYSLAYLESNKWKGWVKVSTNVSSVEGRATSDITYINNEYADLRSGGVSVIYDDILIDKTPTIEALAYDIKPNRDFITISGKGLNTIITFRQGTFSEGEKFYAELKEINSNYVLYSNLLLVPSKTDLIHIWIQRKNNLFNLKITNYSYSKLESLEEVDNLLLGEIDNFSLSRFEGGISGGASI